MTLKWTPRVPDKPGYWLRLKNGHPLAYTVRLDSKELWLYWGEKPERKFLVKDLEQEEGVLWLGPIETK